MASHANVKTIRRPCPVCLNANIPAPSRSRYSGEEWDIIECVSCGFPHLQQVPVYEELEENLAWEKQFETEGKRRRKKQPLIQSLDAATRWRLHLLPRTEGVDILNRLAPSGPALDLGCGTGGYLLRFDQRFVPNGIEISRQQAKVASSHAAARGGRVVQASSEEGLLQFPAQHFTAALLRSYLEHDWRAREVLQNLYTRMAKGGIVVVKVPNYGSLNRRVMGAKWCGFRHPDHVNYFDRRSLRSLAEAAGFTVRQPQHLTMPTDDNMVAILHRH